MNNIVDTVEDRMQNAILTNIDNIVAPKNELAIRSIIASSGRDATSVAANSKCREHIWINAIFEHASGNNEEQQITNGNDETRNNILDEVSELSVRETRFTGNRALITWWQDKQPKQIISVSFLLDVF